MTNTLFLIDPKYRKPGFPNPSTRYRAYHFLQDSGGGLVQFWDQPVSGSFSSAVFVRPRYTDELVRQLTQLSTRKIAVSADFDDLIFAPHLAPELPAVLNKTASLSAIEEMSSQYQAGLMMFNQVSVSTRKLAEWVNMIHPTAQVSVKPNHLPSFGQAAAAPTTAAERHQVHYFSGTRSHQHDLELVAPMLATWLRSNKKHTLVLHGAIRIPEQLQTLNILYYPTCHYLALGDNMEQALASIVPLQDTDFNRCKSAIKFLESAQYGIPVIASPVGEYCDLGDDGPLLAANDNEWLHQLNSLADSRVWQQLAKRQKQRALLHGKDT